MLHNTEYWVVDVGDTEAEPDVAPPVEKLEPELEDEFTHDHAMVAEFPVTIVVLPLPFAVTVGFGMFTLT